MLCFSQLFSFVLLLKIRLCCLSLKFTSCTADIQKSNTPFLFCCCKSDLCIWFPLHTIVCACVCIYVYLVFIWKALGHCSTLSSTTPQGASVKPMISLIILTVLGGLQRGHNYPLLLILFWMHSLLILQINSYISLNCSCLRPVQGHK